MSVVNCYFMCQVRMRLTCAMVWSFAAARRFLLQEARPRPILRSAPATAWGGGGRLHAWCPRRHANACALGGRPLTRRLCCRLLRMSASQHASMAGCRAACRHVGGTAGTLGPTGTLLACPVRPLASCPGAPAAPALRCNTCRGRPAPPPLSRLHCRTAACSRRRWNSARTSTCRSRWVAQRSAAYAGHGAVPWAAVHLAGGGSAHQRLACPAARRCPRFLLAASLAPCCTVRQTHNPDLNRKRCSQGALPHRPSAAG